MRAFGVISEKRGLSEVEDSARKVLQLSDELIEVGRFVIELLHTDIEAAQISDKIRVLIQDVADSIERMPGWGVKLGGFDQMGGNFEVIFFHVGRGVRIIDPMLRDARSCADFPDAAQHKAGHYAKPWIKT